MCKGNFDTALWWDKFDITDRQYHDDGYGNQGQQFHLGEAKD